MKPDYDPVNEGPPSFPPEPEVWPRPPHEFTPDEQRTILASLASQRCPACGNLKRAKQSFCPHCWRRLTWALRGPLYQPAPRYYATFYAAFRYLRDSRAESGLALAPPDPAETAALADTHIFREAEPGPPEPPEAA